MPRRAGRGPLPRFAGRGGALVATPEARARGLRARLPGDLADPAACDTLVGAVVRAFGRLDVLVNNASTFYPTPVGAITTDQFDDLIGPTSRAALPRPGRGAGTREARGPDPQHRGHPRVAAARGHTVYCAAKAGLVMLTRALARELGPEVRVNAIAPGPVMWPEHGVDAELRERIVARTALKRAGSPEDVAKAALFFATDAPFVTGEILAVDGGRLVGGDGR